MNLRKFQGDRIFNGIEMLDKKMVVIADASGIIQEIVHEDEAGDEIEVLPGILSPGFINCHCHLELSHMKGLIPEKTGLVDFVFKVVTQRQYPEEEIFTAIENAEAEMLKNGTVAVGDICNNLFTLPQKLKENLRYYNFIEASGWLPAVAETRFERAKDIFNQFAAAAFLLPAAHSIVPHAPYSVSEVLWQHLSPYFTEKVVTIHNQETAFEDEFFLRGSGDFARMYALMKIDNSFHTPTGKTSLQSYFNRLANAGSVLLVHNSYTGLNDILFAEQEAARAFQQLYWCICINANKYIEDKIPPLAELIKNKANIVLGTDSLAGNWSLSILDEMKSIITEFPSITLEEMLQWATLNGAKALQMDDLLGSFAKGKKPGVILIENSPAGKLSQRASVKRIL